MNNVTAVFYFEDKRNDQNVIGTLVPNKLREVKYYMIENHSIGFWKEWQYSCRS